MMRNFIGVLIIILGLWVAGIIFHLTESKGLRFAAVSTAIVLTLMGLFVQINREYYK
jgi:uncharacterized membrane protein